MIVAARIFAGVVLLVAGALKAADPAQSVLAVGAYGVLPPPLALAGGLLLPGLEIAAGAALLSGFLTRGAAALAALLAIAFLAAVLRATLAHLDVSCGCFGPLSDTLAPGAGTALLDVLLLAASVAVWRRA